MAESASGQDEANPCSNLMLKWARLVLPARDFPLWSRNKKLSFWPYNKSIIDKASSFKMAAGYWPFLFCDLEALTLSWSLKIQQSISSYLEFTLG